MAGIYAPISGSAESLLKKMKSASKSGKKSKASGAEGSGGKGKQKSKIKSTPTGQLPGISQSIPSLLPSDEVGSIGERFKSGKSVISDEDIDDFIDSIKNAPNYMKDALKTLLNDPFYKDLKELFQLIEILSLFKTEVTVEVKRKTYGQDILRSRFEDIMYIGAGDPLAYLTYDKYAKRRLSIVKKIPITELRVAPSYLHNLFDFSASMCYDITYYVKGKAKTINAHDFNKYLAAHNYIVAKNNKFGFTCRFYAETIKLLINSPPEDEFNEVILSSIIHFNESGGTNVSKPLYSLLNDIRFMIDPKGKYFHIILHITDSEYVIAREVIEKYKNMKNCVLIELFFISNKKEGTITCKIAKFEEGAEVIRISLPACANTIAESKIFDYINKACIQCNANRDAFISLFKEYVKRSTKDINLIEEDASLDIA